MEESVTSRAPNGNESVSGEVGRAAFDVLKGRIATTAKRAIAVRVSDQSGGASEPVDLNHIIHEGETHRSRLHQSPPKLSRSTVIRRHTSWQQQSSISSRARSWVSGRRCWMILREASSTIFSAKTAASLLTTSPRIEKRMRDLVKRNLPYRRVEMPKAEAERKFAEMGEPLKCELIEDKGGDVVSCYTIEGTPFIDFCLGPHIPSTANDQGIQAALDCWCPLAGG